MPASFRVHRLFSATHARPMRVSARASDANTEPAPEPIPSRTAGPRHRLATPARAHPYRFWPTRSRSPALLLPSNRTTPSAPWDNLLPPAHGRPCGPPEATVGRRYARSPEPPGTRRPTRWRPAVQAAQSERPEDTLAHGWPGGRSGGFCCRLWCGQCLLLCRANSARSGRPSRRLLGAPPEARCRACQFDIRAPGLATR